MSEHPILFSTEMVRAILDGRKTQTRRIIKNPQRLEGLMLKDEAFQWCPYGKVGDMLWVREDYKYLIQGDLVITYYKYSYNKNLVTYTPINYLDEKTQGKLIKGKQSVWKSKLLMFRFMARIFLEITNIRVERVQDITAADIEAEGIDISIDGISMANHFRGDCWDLWKRLWDSINAKRGYGWDKNPWVWVIEFKRSSLTS